MPEWKHYLFGTLGRKTTYWRRVIVYFEFENLDKDVKTLAEKGFQFDEMPNDKPWLWREARLKDPDGNQLILYHAGENRLNPPWRVKV